MCAGKFQKAAVPVSPDTEQLPMGLWVLHSKKEPGNWGCFPDTQCVWSLFFEQ